MKLTHNTVREFIMEVFDRDKTFLIRRAEEYWNAGAFDIDPEETPFNANDFTIEYTVDEVANICKKELADSDWRVSRAAERGVPVEEAWATYREALRELINNEVSGNISWPEKPE